MYSIHLCVTVHWTCAPRGNVHDGKGPVEGQDLRRVFLLGRAVRDVHKIKRVASEGLGFRVYLRVHEDS